VTTAQILAEQIRGACVGPSGFDVALMDSLQGITAEMAIRKPPGSTHSIWELLLHIVNWEEISTRRLNGEFIRWERDTQMDWPTVEDRSDAAWRRLLSRLDRSNARFSEAVSRLTDAELATPSAGRTDSRYEMILSMLQHSVYHAGQIVIMKKLLTARST
jgi:uncharacterized damage-inducible protein DinB